MTILDQLGPLTNVALAALTILVAFVVVLQAIDRLLIPRVEIRAFEGGAEKDQAVAGMADIVRSELVRLSAEGAGSSLYFFDGPDQALDLPANIKVEPWGTFAQVVSWLPGRITTITGRVQPDGGNGMGVTLTMTNPWYRGGASATIWEADLGGKHAAGDAERYQRLAIASAAWIAYRLLERRPGRERMALLTQDWLSYALFLMATRSSSQEADADVVRVLYQEALERDPRNRGALFGLGLVFALEQANGRAAELFDACVKELRHAYGDEEEELHRDRLWYRAQLNAAIAQLNEVARLRTRDSDAVVGSDFVPPRTKEELRQDASTRLQAMFVAADTTISNLVGDEPAVRHGRYGDLVRFLVNARASAAVNLQISHV